MGLSQQSLPGASPVGPLICDTSGALFDEVVLKAVPIVVPHPAKRIYYQRFLEDIGDNLVPRRGHWFLRKASVNTPKQAITAA